MELYYYNTLGGCSISINSRGYVQAINTLTHTKRQVGVPRNVIARWFSETDNPERDFKKMREIPRASGYNHCLVSSTGEVWDIEATDTKQVLWKPAIPLVHTNHYLSELKTFDRSNNVRGTKDRYAMAVSRVKPEMDVEELIDVTSDTSKGSKVSILNARTIARMVVNVEVRIARVWLRREEDKGWIDYELDFLEPCFRKDSV